MTHKVRERRRQRPRTNSLMCKRLERQPKSKKKAAKTLPKANQVSAPACDRGLGIDRPKIGLVSRAAECPLWVKRGPTRPALCNAVPKVGTKQDIGPFLTVSVK
jgi:hypothetical protein